MRIGTRLSRAAVIPVVLVLAAVACSKGSTSSGNSSSAATSAATTPNQSQAPIASGEPNPGTGPEIAAVGDLVCAFGTQPAPIMVEHDRKHVCNPIPVTRAVHAKPYDAFLPLGDLQYSYGGYWRYQKYWDKFYGDVKNITHPAPGNHEGYADFTGYTKYFGHKRVHMPKRVENTDFGDNPGRITGYYSYNLGDWHLIALNSQLCMNRMWNLRTRWTHPIKGGGCGPNDPMMTWLAKDLQQHANASCTLAYFHHSPYVVRDYKGTGPQMVAPLVNTLDQGGVDVILTGHDHDYQRWGPIDASGNADPTGFTAFVVGTGGDSYQPIPDQSKWPDTLKVAHTGTYGLLDMHLNTGSYTYDFVTGKGEKPFSDSGTGTCD